MTRRKRARARRARNAFARRVARPLNEYRALFIRLRWPLGAWCSLGMMMPRGPEHRRMRRLHGDA